MMKFTKAITSITQFNQVKKDSVTGFDPRVQLAKTTQAFDKGGYQLFVTSPVAAQVQTTTAKYGNTKVGDVVKGFHHVAQTHAQAATLQATR